MIDCEYLLVTGAPGSRWSGVVRDFYYSPDINTSDYSLGESLTDKVSAFECETIKDSLTKNSGRIGKTAESLKIPRKKLYLRMQKYGLNPDKFK